MKNSPKYPLLEKGDRPNTPQISIKAIEDRLFFDDLSESAQKCVLKKINSDEIFKHTAEQLVKNCIPFDEFENLERLEEGEEIYNYFLVSNELADRLAEAGAIISRNNKICLSVWGCTTYGDLRHDKFLLYIFKDAR